MEPGGWSDCVTIHASLKGRGQSIQFERIDHKKPVANRQRQIKVNANGSVAASENAASFVARVLRQVALGAVVGSCVAMAMAVVGV